MRRIKVLQLVASSRGGGASYVRDLAVGLSHDHRFQVTVAMPTDGGNVSLADFAAAGIPFEVVDIAEGFAWREVIRLRRLFKREGFDLVHVHGSRAALFGRLAAWSVHPRPRVVFSIHGFATPYYPFIKRWTYLGFERALQSLTDRTICVAQAEADLFSSLGLAKPQSIEVVAPGIDVARFAGGEAGLGEGIALRRDLQLGQGQVVLMACRLNVPRDFCTLLVAFSMVAKESPTARLVIAGDGPQRGEVEALVARLELTDNVRIIGFRRDVPALMALADVYVLTSYAWEGFPISTLEAQAAGRPVVVTDAGGSKEAVLHEKTGLVVPKCSPQLLADALLRLLRDRDLRWRLGQAGRRRSREEFTRQRMVDRIACIYADLLVEGTTLCEGLEKRL